MTQIFGTLVPRTGRPVETRVSSSAGQGQSVYYQPIQRGSSHDNGPPLYPHAADFADHLTNSLS